MKHLLLGAGLFGRSLALRLVELGAEVFIVDHNEGTLEQIRDLVSSAIIAESTDKETLRTIVDECKPDYAVICFGESFDATLMTVIYLKEFGVGKIFARASSYMQGEILKRLGVSSVILPEALMGQRLASTLILGESEQLLLDSENSIVKVRIPQLIVGKKLTDLKAEKHGVKVLFVHREYIEHKVSKTIFPDENPKLENGDNLVLLGSARRITKFVARISE